MLRAEWIMFMICQSSASLFQNAGQEGRRNIPQDIIKTNISSEGESMEIDGKLDGYLRH